MGMAMWAVTIGITTAEWHVPWSHGIMLCGHGGGPLGRPACGIVLWPWICCLLVTEVRAHAITWVVKAVAQQQGSTATAVGASAPSLLHSSACGPAAPTCTAPTCTALKQHQRGHNGAAWAAAILTTRPPQVGKGIWACYTLLNASELWEVQ